MLDLLNNGPLLLFIKSLFELYLTVLCIRLILAWSQANYFNPITQVIIQLTQPIIGPLRRLIPNYKRIEFSTLVFTLGLEILKIELLQGIWVKTPFLFVALLGVHEFIYLILTIFLYAILIHAIASWVFLNETPFTQVVRQLASPILRPLQRWIPPIGALDISSLLALIGLQFLRMWF